MKFYSTEAIILSRKNFGETDKLITLFTKRFGKKKALAKGVRKINSRRAPNLEIFTKVNIYLHQGKSIDYITEVVSLEQFANIRQKLGRVAYAYIVSELVERLTAENQENNFIYNKLAEILFLLNQTDLKIQQAEKLLCNFKITVLYNLGFIEDNNYSDKEVDKIINQILETRLKSPKLLTNIV